MKNIAAILAGGSGTRMGLGRPKQFLEMAGKTVLEHAVDAFHAHPLIDTIIIVSNPDFTHQAEAIAQRRRAAGQWTKVAAVIPGGKERSDSSVHALQFVATAFGADIEDEEPESNKGEAGRLAEINILFHDAVRPLVDQRIIGDVVEALATHRAVNVTLPVVDTIVSARDGRMTATVDRSTLQRVQTPQGFRLGTIVEAYRRALADPDFRATDDCGVVLRYLPDEPIALVRGSEQNLKLTYPDDVRLLEFLLDRR